MFCLRANNGASIANVHSLTPRIGIAVRLWQLGIEMRPLLGRDAVWMYPLFAGVGGSFGYWLQGVETRQWKILAERREALLAKRRRRDERDLVSKIEEAGMLSATS
jgi:hypothetical protein